MIKKLEDFWDRVTVQWHVVAAAFIAALPAILDHLGWIDLTPILSTFLPENLVTLVVGILPFVLAFLKPMLIVEPVETE